MDGGRAEQALGDSAALLTGVGRVIRHRLEEFENVAVGAAVFVDRHSRRDYGSAPASSAR